MYDKIHYKKKKKKKYDQNPKKKKKKLCENAKNNIIMTDLSSMAETNTTL